MGIRACRAEEGMAKIGIMATTDATTRNMEHVLFRISEILAQAHVIDLVGAKNASGRIAERFSIYAPEFPPSWMRFLPGWSVLSRVRLMRRYIREKKPDIVMAVSSIGVNGLAVALAGRMEGVPSVVRLTSDVFRICRTQPGALRKARMFLRNNILGRMSMILADKVVLLHAAQLPGVSGVFRPRKKFFVVPQPVSFPLSPDRAECRRSVLGSLGVPEGALVIGSTLRLDRDKKIPLMAEVIERVLSRNTAAHFIIVGEGEMKDWLRARLSGRTSVHFVPAMPRDDLARYYRSFDRLVHMSGSEGLANVIIEGIYFGLPVIASDSGIVTRAISANVSDDPEKLADMILDPSVRPVPLPPELEPERNAGLWLGLVEAVLAGANENKRRAA